MHKKNKILKEIEKRLSSINKIYIWVLSALILVIFWIITANPFYSLVIVTFIIFMKIYFESNCQNSGLLAKGIPLLIVLLSIALFSFNSTYFNIQFLYSLAIAMLYWFLPVVVIIIFLLLLTLIHTKVNYNIIKKFEEEEPKINIEVTTLILTLLVSAFGIFQLSQVFIPEIEYQEALYLGTGNTKIPIYLSFSNQNKCGTYEQNDVKRNHLEYSDQNGYYILEEFIYLEEGKEKLSRWGENNFLFSDKQLSTKIKNLGQSSFHYRYQLEVVEGENTFVLSLRDRNKKDIKKNLSTKHILKSTISIPPQEGFAYFPIVLFKDDHFKLKEKIVTESDTIFQLNRMYSKELDCEKTENCKVSCKVKINEISTLDMLIEKINSYLQGLSKNTPFYHTT